MNIPEHWQLSAIEKKWIEIMAKRDRAVVRGIALSKEKKMDEKRWAKEALLAQSACNGIALCHSLARYVREYASEDPLAGTILDLESTWQDAWEWGMGTKESNELMSGWINDLVYKVYLRTMTNDPIITLFVAQLQWLANGKSVPFTQWSKAMDYCEKAKGEK